ncbi:flagellar hook-length control protein FliK [Novosphingobium sp. AP12]|uniref:flagellar hook-length control protein FliK n=1 Tax=Novosphingobium sp. AP12 TaxID=1144305 RepID=UPI0003172075|nr:flagellar hook-length control protein FliK [Novosphingobium sp. AP12]
MTAAPAGDAAARGAIAAPEPGAFLAALENARGAPPDVAGKARLAMPAPVETPPPAGMMVTSPAARPAVLTAESATPVLDAAPVVAGPARPGPDAPALAAPETALPEPVFSAPAEPVSAETVPPEPAAPAMPGPEALTKDAVSPEVSASPAPAAPPALPAPPVPPSQAAGTPDAEPVQSEEEKLAQRDAKAPDDGDRREPVKRKAPPSPAPLAGPLQDGVQELKAQASTPPIAVAVAVNTEAAPGPAAQDSAPEGAGKPAPPATAEPIRHAHAAVAAPAGTEAPVDPLSGGTPALPEPRLSAPVFTQTLEAATARHAASPYGNPPAETAVTVREGRFGADIGVTIARALDAGTDGKREDLLIRLDPRHMGRVEVRMSFEHDGVLRAVVSADSPAALDMLRRESADLGRALADAGVRSDGQSLRFDGGGAGGGQRQGARPQGGPSPGSDFAGSGSEDPIHRPLRSSGHVDLMA